MAISWHARLRFPQGTRHWACSDWCHVLADPSCRANWQIPPACLASQPQRQHSCISVTAALLAPTDLQAQVIADETRRALGPESTRVAPATQWHALVAPASPGVADDHPQHLRVSRTLPMLSPPLHSSYQSSLRARVPPPARSGLLTARRWAILPLQDMLQGLIGGRFGPHVPLIPPYPQPAPVWSASHVDIDHGVRVMSMYTIKCKSYPQVISIYPPVMSHKIK